MTNPSYRVGRRFEYYIMQILAEALNPKDYTIIRTAGSHSPVDVIVLKHVGKQGKKREYFGIQCKTKKVKTSSNISSK